MVVSLHYVVLQCTHIHLLNSLKRWWLSTYVMLLGVVLRMSWWTWQTSSLVSVSLYFSGRRGREGDNKINLKTEYGSICCDITSDVDRLKKNIHNYEWSLCSLFLVMICKRTLLPNLCSHLNISFTEYVALNVIEVSFPNPEKWKNIKESQTNVEYLLEIQRKYPKSKKRWKPKTILMLH